MTNTNEDLVRRIEALVAEHIASTRRAMQEAIERAFAAAVVVDTRAASPQCPSHAGVVRQRSRSSSAVGKKRRARADLAAHGGRFYGELSERPGGTRTALAEEVG